MYKKQTNQIVYGSHGVLRCPEFHKSKAPVLLRLLVQGHLDVDQLAESRRGVGPAEAPHKTPPRRRATRRTSQPNGPQRCSEA